MHCRSAGGDFLRQRWDHQVHFIRSFRILSSLTESWFLLRWVKGGIQSVAVLRTVELGCLSACDARKSLQTLSTVITLWLIHFQLKYRLNRPFIDLERVEPNLAWERSATAAILLTAPAGYKVFNQP